MARPISSMSCSARRTAGMRAQRSGWRSSRTASRSRSTANSSCAPRDISAHRPLQGHSCRSRTSRSRMETHMTIRPHLGLTLFGAILAGLVALADAEAQTYPNRPITFVVPFAPGGLSDVPARVLAAVMQERIGASIVVENKTGASGVIGATHVWRAEPDGY